MMSKHDFIKLIILNLINFIDIIIFFQEILNSFGVFVF
jgi:hypothetical protein